MTRHARRAATLVALLLALLLPAGPARAAKDPPMAPPESVEDARQRLAFLKKAGDSIDAWVEWKWGNEFDKANPGLSRDPAQGASETAQAYKERQMKIRMALSEAKTRLRAERADWLAQEKERLLAAVIAEPLPVKLGPYEADRGRFPLLLGYGWPSGVSISLKVPEKARKAFEVKFPDKVPATFRVNEQGEVHLLSAEKRWEDEGMEVFAAPPGPRLAWQAAHESWVTAVAFRPDGAQVVSTGADSAVAVREAESGNVVFRLDKVEMAMAVAYAPDGAAFATGGADSVLRVRSSADGKELWTAQAKGMIMAVAFSPDGRLVAFGDETGRLRVLNAESGDEKYKLEEPTTIRAIDFTRGGKGLVVGGEGNRILLWELGSDRIAWRKTTEWPVYAVAGSPAGGVIAAGGGGSEVTVLKESDGTEVWDAKTEGEVRALRFDPAGRLLAVGGAGYKAKVFPATGGAAVWAAEIGNPIRALAFGPDGRTLFVGSAEGGLRMFNVDEGDRVQAAFGAAGRIYIDRRLVDKLFR